VPMFPEFLPYYEEALKHRKGGQRYLFPHCRKDDVKDFRNVATPIRKKLKKAGVECWKLFFDSLRGSCITRKENSKQYTSKQMTAMFGNSEWIRQSRYIHDMELEDYAALGGLYDSAVSSGESVKKSPLISPFSGRISDILPYLNELAARRLTFSDLCKMLYEERGLDTEWFNEVATVNPVVSKMSSFANSLLMDAYDDMPRKTSWVSFVWQCCYNVSKTLFLIRELYRNFTVPQAVLEAHSGGQGIRVRSCKSLQELDLGQSLECAGTECGTLCESPIETLVVQEIYDLATAWSSLPSSIRVAIVLLVEQHTSIRYSSQFNS